MATDSGHPCAHCGGLIYGSKKTCSDECAKIAAGTHWPSPVGPATKAEMEGWIAAARGQQAQSIAAMVQAAQRLAEQQGHPLTEAQANEFLASGLAGHFAQLPPPAPGSRAD